MLSPPGQGACLARLPFYKRRLASTVRSIHSLMPPQIRKYPPKNKSCFSHGETTSHMFRKSFLHRSLQIFDIPQKHYTISHTFRGTKSFSFSHTFRGTNFFLVGFELAAESPISRLGNVSWTEFLFSRIFNGGRIPNLTIGKQSDVGELSLDFSDGVHFRALSYRPLCVSVRIWEGQVIMTRG